MSDSLRERNRAIGENYRTVVFEPPLDEWLEPVWVYGLASLAGNLRPPADMLDIGCGIGKLLAKNAQVLPGRLVGVDISSHACALAREELAFAGDRARIIEADLLEVQPADLGQFDLIYAYGLLYVVPPEVRRHVFALIGACLRQGGVAVMSYYAGGPSSVRAILYRTLRRLYGHLPPAEAVHGAREYVRATIDRLGDDPGNRAWANSLATALRLQDSGFYHEVLNGEFEPLQTSVVEQELSAYGMGFAGYLREENRPDLPDSLSRAIAADQIDLFCGGYQLAVFTKADAPQASFVERPDSWASLVSRDNGGDYSGEQTFFTNDRDRSVSTDNPATIAMLDCMMGGDRLSWSELVDQVGQRIAAAGLALDDGWIRQMEADLIGIWRHRLVYPSARLSGSGGPSGSS